MIGKQLVASRTMYLGNLDYLILNKSSSLMRNCTTRTEHEDGEGWMNLPGRDDISGVQCSAVCQTVSVGERILCSSRYRPSCVRPIVPLSSAAFAPALSLPPPFHPFLLSLFLSFSPPFSPHYTIGNAAAAAADIIRRTKNGEGKYEHH